MDLLNRGDFLEDVVIMTRIAIAGVANIARLVTTVGNTRIGVYRGTEYTSEYSCYLMEIQLNTPYVRVYVSTRLGINVISLSVSKSTALSVDKHKYRWLFSHIYMRAITYIT